MKEADLDEKMADHNLVEDSPAREILVERKPVRDNAGNPVEGLYNVWITLNNPKEYNAYTTDMIKEIIKGNYNLNVADRFIIHPFELRNQG